MQELPETILIIYDVPKMTGSDPTKGGAYSFPVDAVDLRLLSAEQLQVQVYPVILAAFLLLVLLLVLLLLLLLSPRTSTSTSVSCGHG